jgi:hypothetical protein
LGHLGSNVPFDFWQKEGTRHVLTRDISKSLFTEIFSTCRGNIESKTTSSKMESFWQRPDPSISAVRPCWVVFWSFKHRTYQGYFAKIQESPKLVIKKHPSSQIAFFTDKLLTEFGFEACQIWIIWVHLNCQIWLFVWPEELNIWLFRYSVIWLFGWPKEPHIRLFGYSGAKFASLSHLNEIKETEFDNKSGS